MSTEYFIACEECEEGGHIGSIIEGGTLVRVHHPLEIMEAILRFKHTHEFHEVTILSEGMYFGKGYKEVFSDIHGTFLTEEIVKL